MILERQKIFNFFGQDTKILQDIEKKKKTFFFFRYFRIHKDILRHYNL